VAGSEPNRVKVGISYFDKQSTQIQLQGKALLSALFIKFVSSHLLVMSSLQAEELRILREKTPKDLWKEDMDAFTEKLDVSCVTSLLFSAPVLAHNYH